MDERHTLSAVTMQFALACNLCTLVYLTTLSRGTVNLYFPLVLLAYAPAVYGLDRLFLRRPRTMRGLVLLNAAAGLGLFASVCIIDGWENWAVLLFSGLFCLWPTVQGGILAMEPPDLRKTILCLDASAAVLVLFISFLSATGRSIYWAAPISAGCAAAILGVVSRRISRPMGHRDWGIVLLAFCAVFAVMLLVVSFAAAPAGYGVVALWNGLMALGRFLLNLLWRLLVFLTSLFPDPEYGELPPAETYDLPMQEQMAAAEENPAVVVILLVLSLTALVFLLGWLLRRLGKLHVGGRQAAKGRSQLERRRRLSLWRALRRLLAALGARLQLRAFLWRQRNTPRGLFCLLVHRCRLGPWHKRPGETPREFLTRLQESAQSDGELASALNALIPAVDQALYAPVPDNGPIPGAGLIRRRTGAALRRQFLRRCRDSLQGLLQPAKKA